MTSSVPGGAERWSPFVCASCETRLRNDEDTLWLGESWDDREPYCRECAPEIKRDLARKGI